MCSRYTCIRTVTNVSVCLGRGRRFGAIVCDDTNSYCQQQDQPVREPTSHWWRGVTAGKPSVTGQTTGWRDRSASGV